MVTRIIDLELDLHDRDTAELIKKYPLAKVEGLLFLRFEDGSVKFASEPLPPELFARVVIVAGDTLVPVRSSKRLSIDRIALVRREAKRKVFIANAERALRRVAPDGDLRQIGSVALVGGSSQDFEIADLLAEHLMAYRITTGRPTCWAFCPLTAPWLWAWRWRTTHEPWKRRYETRGNVPREGGDAQRHGTLYEKRRWRPGEYHHPDEYPQEQPDFRAAGHPGRVHVGPWGWPSGRPRPPWPLCWRRSRAMSSP